jgi:restriction system protein
MKTHARTLTRDILRGALDAIRLPFSWSAAAPAGAPSRFRRSGRESAESGLAAARAQLDTSSWNLALLKHLEWRRFEELAAAYFEALGFTPRIARSQECRGDDIGLAAAGSEETAIVVHCRPWNAYRVGIKSVRELRAAMDSHGAGEGVLVTPGRFTEDAIARARAENIRLIDGADLIGKLSALPPEQARALLALATRGDFLTPTCPRCAVKMVARQSTEGGRRFWGCPNYPKCKEIVFGPAPG